MRDVNESALQVGDQTLANNLQAGDERAFDTIFARYAERLIKLAHSRISERLSSRIEAEDIVQSVFRTFYCRVRNQQFTFDDQDDLWKLLVSMTLNKLRNKVDWHTAAKRDVSAERPLLASDDRVSAFDLDGETPSPEAVVMFMDLMEHFMAELREGDRKILEMRLQGATQEEIATEMGCTERTVRRTLERIRTIAEAQGMREQLVD